MSNYYEYPPYVSVAERRAKAARKLKVLRKKNPDIQPVVIEGRAIASTWWGKSWNQNLERYADFAYRLDRGRSYVRHGGVLDLRIEPGEIRALVQGSQAKPYEVEISIKALAKSTWKGIREAAEGQLDSLAELLGGKFPKSLQELFFSRDKGFFPSPKEIRFDCSCPDLASMCKHVAATLYGVGARLDEKPNLFFELRKIEVDALISQAVKSTTRTLLKKAETRSSRVMDDADLTDVFGIELDDDIGSGQEAPKPRGKKAAKGKRAKMAPRQKTRVVGKSAVGKTAGRKSPGKTAAQKKKPGKKAVKPAEKPVPSRKSSAKPTARRGASPDATSTGVTFVDLVVAAIPRRRKKVGIAEICAQVELSESQVRNAVTRAVEQGRLEKRGRGVYMKP